MRKHASASMHMLRQTTREHICPHCNRYIRSSAYHAHERACKRSRNPRRMRQKGPYNAPKKTTG